MVNQVCLANIEQKGGTYCDTLNPRPPGQPSYCGEIQSELSELCQKHDREPEYPMVQNSPNGKCYCCCSCFGYRTPIQVGRFEDDEYMFVENILPGQMVLTTNAEVSEWSQNEVTEIGGIAPELHMDFMFFISFKFENGTESSIVVTADHLFLMPNNKLRSANNLRTGDELKQANGLTAKVTLVAHGSWTGGVRSLSFGNYKKGEPLDGHLMNSNGVITADLSVQSVYYGADLGDLTDELDRVPLGSPEFFAESKDAKAYLEFVNSPEMWPMNFVPMPSELFNIPVSAKGFLSDIQARNVKANMAQQDPGNSFSISLTQYVFSIASAFYDDVVFLIDWNNPTPNAWYFNQSQQNFIVLSGALTRQPFFGVAGLSMIVSNLIARFEGATCTGDADYAGAGDVMRLMWLDDLYIDMFNEGLDEVKALFDLIDPKNREEDPNNICNQPSTACRVDTMMNGSMLRGLPDCAVPPPAFRLDAAYPTQTDVVTFEFSGEVDPISVRPRKNYHFKPELKVNRARADASDQRKVHVKVTGLEAGVEYEVRVTDVLDLRGQEISDSANTAKFTMG